MITLFAYPQQVARNWVLVEIGTGGWCYYCPGAAMGADDLHLNGDPVAIIENHNGDPYATTDSDARNSYYGITGYPTAWFDGSYDEVVGGSNTTSMYSSYEPIVSSRILIDSDFTLDIYGSNVGDDYDLIIHVQDVGGYSGGDNIALRFALTESDIQYSWQGQTEMNFVNRLMVPDHNGTDLSSYDLTSLTAIDLEFTFNNTWVDTECELVIFLQDDDTQEVLQSQQVGLLDLIALLQANFEADATLSCTGSSVNFSDLSLGENILSWSWAFDGGSPATSSDQNPSVTYSTPGTYDVELTVTDATGSDTKNIPGYITIYETPAQAETPSGDVAVCTGQYYTYTIAEIPYTQTYEWEVDPANAGTLYVNDNSMSLNVEDDFTGDFDLRVRATNLCGDGIWSDNLIITSNASPDEFTIEGGGSYCEDGSGAEITLNGSETGIDYELFIDDVSTGIIVAGTGSELSFGDQTDEGYYTVMGYNTECNINMLEQVQVFVLYPPGGPAAPVGSASVCNDVETEYTTTGIESADTYTWYLSPEDAGDISGSGMQANVAWNQEYEGLVDVTVVGLNTCGEGTPSDILQVDVDDIPEPVVEGENDVCDNTEEPYMVEETAGNEYTWEVAGGSITNGQGTSTITVMWGEAGEGTIYVEEETPNGCWGEAIQFDVVIDGCTGIGENNLDKLIKMNPNPAKDFVLITSKQTINSVSVLDLRGKVIENHIVNGTELKINMAQYESGLYLVKIVTDDGNISKRLIIE